MSPGSAAQWIEHQTENQRLLVHFQVWAHAWVEARSPLGGMREATDKCFSHTLMFLFLFLPSPLSKK